MSQEEFAEAIDDDLETNRPSEMANLSGNDVTFITASSTVSETVTATVTDGITGETENIPGLIRFIQDDK